MGQVTVAKNGPVAEDRTVLIDYVAVTQNGPVFGDRTVLMGSLIPTFRKPCSPPPSL